MSAIRPAFIHIGTHKTGTTSLQVMLATNDRTFRDAGLFVPHTGRIDPHSAGQHNIVWELGHDQRFSPARGTFAELLQEIAMNDAPAVCLTSEDFEFCHRDQHWLERLRDGLRAIGYEPAIICYLRPQADYLESLYAEISPAWDVDFSRFLRTILSAGGFYGCAQFDYDILTAAFARAFGRHRMIVRAYHASAPSHALIEEFVTLVAPRVKIGSLTLPGRLNSMRTFGSVVAAREKHLGIRVGGDLPTGRFDPLTLRDLSRIALRFTATNARIAEIYATFVAPVTAERLAREVLAEFFRTRDSLTRKHLIRELRRDTSGTFRPRARI